MYRREERIQAGIAPSRKQERSAWKQKRKLMKQNVLYLMIVNLPTEQEMEMAKVDLEKRDPRMR